MAILVQRMIESEISFIIHSVDPISDDKNIVYMELALGQGETLASANQSGTPFRLTYNKNTGNVTIISFSSYSYALYADQSSKNLVKKCNDNSQNEFYKNHKYLLSLGQELG
jgi:phosphoglucan,water dikinase